MPIEVKICGMTNSDDVKYALEYGADYCGFVLYRKSARGINATRLEKIISEINVPFKAVAVFVDEDRDVIQKISEEAGLYAVQLHGCELPVNYVDFPVPIWRAIRSMEGEYQPEPSLWKPERYLVDSTAPGVMGGSGVAADWKMAADFAAKRRVMLAGGLTPENVVAAIKQVRPVGVDVASGVESKPGLKDRAVMKRFIENVKAVRM